MQMTHREFWTAVHGMIFGAAFLLAFAGGFVLLWSLRAEWVTGEGERHNLRMLKLGTWSMALLAWATVIVGTYVVYPWYRAKPPAGTQGAALVEYPKFLLVSKPATAEWHVFGMEWKEHVAWFAPIVATVVAFVVTRYGRQVANDAWMRRTLLFLFTVAFFSAAVAGMLGALINKVAPTR